jgi:hypothetical protein
LLASSGSIIHVNNAWADDITCTDSNDTLTGTINRDTISGLAGDDLINLKEEKTKCLGIGELIGCMVVTLGTL